MTSPTSGASSPSAGANFCAACGATLSVGARFCHRCGTPAGQGAPVTTRPAAPSGAAAVLPWAVAFVALLALVAMVAGKNFGASKGSAVDGSANSLPTQAMDGAAAPPAGAPGGGPGGGPAPDISNASPSELANRLYNRIMTYAENGVVDSVAFFAPMALGAHAMLEVPTLDERYHFGRVAEVADSADVARAQADTILTQQPDNLLGLLLASRAARMRKDDATAKRFDQRLLQVLGAQLATGNTDYRDHRTEIDRAVEDAKRK